MPQPPHESCKLLALSFHELFSYYVSNLQKSARNQHWAPEALHRLEEFNASNNLMKESICFLSCLCLLRDAYLHDLAWL